MLSISVSFCCLKHVIHFGGILGNLKYLLLTIVFFALDWLYFPRQDYPDDLDADCSRFFSGVLVGSPSLRLSDSEKKEIYRIHLDDVMKDMRLDERDKVLVPGIHSLPET